VVKVNDPVFAESKPIETKKKIKRNVLFVLLSYIEDWMEKVI